MSSRGSLRRRDLHYVLVILLLVIHRVSASTAHSTETYVEDTDRFPGWKGELPRVQQPDPHSVGYGEGGVVSTCTPKPPSRRGPQPAHPLPSL